MPPFGHPVIDSDGALPADHVIVTFKFRYDHPQLEPVACALEVEKITLSIEVTLPSTHVTIAAAVPVTFRIPHASPPATQLLGLSVPTVIDTPGIVTEVEQDLPLLHEDAAAVTSSQLKQEKSHRDGRQRGHSLWAVF